MDLIQIIWMDTTRRLGRLLRLCHSFAEPVPSHIQLICLCSSLLKGDMALPALLFPTGALRYKINEVIYCIQQQIKKKRRCWLFTAHIQEAAMRVQRAQMSPQYFFFLSFVSLKPVTWLLNFLPRMWGTLQADSDPLIQILNGDMSRRDSRYSWISVPVK